LISRELNEETRGKPMDSRFNNCSLSIKLEKMKKHQKTAAAATLEKH